MINPCRVQNSSYRIAQTLQYSAHIAITYSLENALRLSLFAIAAFCMSNLAARADTFTFSVGGYTFSLPSTPTSYSTATDSIIFQNVSVTNGSTATLEEVGFENDDPFTKSSNLVIGRTVDFDNGGGYSANFPLYADGLTTSAIFGGTPENPTFEAGTYGGSVVYGPGNGTLVITSSSVTPEPSSIALLGTGLLGFAGVVRKRLA